MADLTAGSAQGSPSLGQATLRDLLDDTLSRVIELFQADAGGILVSDERTHELVLTSQQGISAQFAAREARLPFGTCMCGHSIETEESLFLVDDVTRDPRCVVGTCLEDGFLSLLCLPLRASGKVWGLLRLHSRQRGAFQGRDTRLLAFISSQLGLAIQRASLQEEIARLFRRIEEERAALDSLMRSLVDGLILLDGQGAIAYWNPSAERYLGIEAQAVLGQPLSVAIERLVAAAPELAEAAGQLLQAVREADSCPQFDLQLAAPAPRTLQARLFPIEGRKGCGIMLRDVTSERHLDEIKSQLLSTVSHELRTPLASIKGFASTLLRDDVQWDPATQREFLQIIDQESDRLGELIGNLLEMSRIEAGALRIDCDWLEPRALLEEAVDEMRLHTAGQTLALDAPEDLPTIYADGRRIRQVLHNLLENAIKYSTGGEIQVMARDDGQALQISVRDEGFGIAPDQVERIFDRFYQASSPARHRAGGAGLGLSICKGLVEAHGGRIWVESTPGVGSVFHFSLPYQGDREGRVKRRDGQGYHSGRR